MTRVHFSSNRVRARRRNSHSGPVVGRMSGEWSIICEQSIRFENSALLRRNPDV